MEQAEEYPGTNRPHGDLLHGKPLYSSQEEEFSTRVRRRLKLVSLGLAQFSKLYVTNWGVFKFLF